ncbi:MAG: acyl-CoA dehydrogenase family protein [Actinomycetota bacterium]
MDLRHSAADEQFRAEIRDWLRTHLTGRFAPLIGTGGPGSEHEYVELRRDWERHLGLHGWIGLAWPEEHGGCGASLTQQLIFHEEYARAGGPARLDHIGEHLLAPTLIAAGSKDQCERFLPAIRSGETLWCQGYSEPGAGSDLAGVKTRAELRDGEWHVQGQKIWTSLAHLSEWCFVLARTEAGSERHRGLSYLLVPMDQPGVQVVPITQLTGTSEFNEVFFDDARTPAANVVGEPGDGWRVALGTLEAERGVSTLDQQLAFQREFDGIVARAKANGAFDDPLLRARIERTWAALVNLRHTALRMLGSPDLVQMAGPVLKLLWAPFHRDLGELAVDVLGSEATLAEGEPYELNFSQRLYLYTRADTIYGGSNEIQRNIIAERVLGLPRS